LKKDKWLVTSALPYANGPIHFGHVVGAYLNADIFVRHLKLCGEDVVYICGTDEHGVAITIAAEQAGVSPREHVDKYYLVIKDIFDKFRIEFDNFSRTTWPPHYEISQRFFLDLYEGGHISEKESEQFYCATCNRFLADRYIIGICPKCGFEPARGDECSKCGAWLEPDQLINPRCRVCGNPPVKRLTKHHYLRLQDFTEPLKKWLATKSDWKENVKSFIANMIVEGLEERPITRDIEWGIPVPLPGTEGKVLYVWFDAPIGYVSFTEQWCRSKGAAPGEYMRWWKDPNCKIVHFIGEDNVVFHALIWPAMLMGEGTFQLPHNIPANCFLNIQFPGREEEKISKSRGTAVWIKEYLQGYDPDPLRYHLTAIAPEQQRTAFKFGDLIRRNNEELVAALGNFVHRNTTFAHRYFEGRIPSRGQTTDQDRAQLAMVAGLADRVGALIEQYRFKDALEELMAAAHQSNRYFDYRQPWALRKTDREACGTVINVCLNTVKALGVVMAPFLPFAAAKTAAMLSAAPAEAAWSAAAQPLPEGRALGEPVILFHKIEEPADEGSA